LAVTIIKWIVNGELFNKIRLPNVEMERFPTLTPTNEEYLQALELILPLRTGAGTLTVREIITTTMDTTNLKQRDYGWCLFWPKPETLTKRDQIKIKTLAVKRKQNLETMVS
jgi:hypothetical protein